jgi:hypothetical protein
LNAEQAHSLGRDAALRRPRAPLRDSRTAQRAVPTVWLNLVCLDAPIVAVAWLALFARTCGLPLRIGNTTALFLTAWLIYLGDRLADSATIEANGPQSLRQQFCRRHRRIWIVTVALVASVDAYVIWRTTALETLLAGAAVGGLALIYLVLNHPLGLIWRSLPAKELAIGVLFAAGTLVALLPGLKNAAIGFPISATFFAVLCALNCISIARWECGLDRAQGKVSIATRHPRIARASGLIALLLGVAVFVMATVFHLAAPLFACLSVSALLLSWLNSVPMDVDRRTALADLVLLTPIIPLIFMAL